MIKDSDSKMECFKSVGSHYSCMASKFFEVWQRRADSIHCLRSQMTFVGAVQRPTFPPTLFPFAANFSPDIWKAFNFLCANVRHRCERAGLLSVFCNDW